MPDKQTDNLENLIDALATGVIALDKANKINTKSINILDKQSFHKEFEQINNASLEDIKQYWCQLYNCKIPPKFSKTALAYKLKYRLQELIYGGLSKEAKILLQEAIDQYVLRKPQKVEVFNQYPIGTRITRIYKDNPYTITILQNGYLYNDIPYKNLTAVVRKIIGTSHWSGARFFGLDR
jgi:hypothetical protein